MYFICYFFFEKTNKSQEVNTANRLEILVVGLHMFYRFYENYWNGNKGLSPVQYRISDPKSCHSVMTHCESQGNYLIQQARIRFTTLFHPDSYLGSSYK